jgi:hypothetical protein
VACPSAQSAATPVDLRSGFLQALSNELVAACPSPLDPRSGHLLHHRLHFEKEHFFKSEERLDLLTDLLLENLSASSWRADAWAVFPNHYHLIVRSSAQSRPLSRVLGKIHMLSSKEVNLQDKTPGAQGLAQLPRYPSYLPELALRPAELRDPQSGTSWDRAGCQSLPLVLRGLV